MTIWNDCKMTTFFYSGQEAHVDFPCVVKLQKGKILVEYQDGDYVQYEGKEIGSGHYVLNLLERDGKASLHIVVV